MAYAASPGADPRGKLLLFGGASANGEVFKDTWSWDVSKWTEEHPAHSPPGRWAAVMAQNTGSGLVLFGGSQTAPDLNFDRDLEAGGPDEQMLCDTWTWNGSDWEKRHPATSPPVGDHGLPPGHQPGRALRGDLAG